MTKGPRIALVMNVYIPEDWGKDMEKSFVHLIHASVPEASVDVFTPLRGDILPDPRIYSLILLSGGVFNLLESPFDDWVDEELAMIRETAESCPDTKLVGICWGHQAIALALGGRLDVRSEGSNIRVEEISLTEKGKKFFSNASKNGSLKIHKYHRRLVYAPAPSQESLANNNEILISMNNRILSFQGHPEMTASFSKALMSHDSSGYLRGKSPEETKQLLEGIEMEHQGPDIFADIMNWAFKVESSQ